MCLILDIWIKKELAIFVPKDIKVELEISAKGTFKCEFFVFQWLKTENLDDNGCPEGHDLVHPKAEEVL